MLKKLAKIYVHAEEIALAYISLGLGILIVLEIMLRTTGITAFFWLEELGRYVLIFMTLCGASLAVKHDRHPSMTVLYTTVPTQAAHVIKAVVSLFLSVFFAYFDYYAWLHIVGVYKIGQRTSTLGVAFYIAYLPIAFFGFVICLRYFLGSAKELHAFFKEMGHFGPRSAAVSEDKN